MTSISVTTSGSKLYMYTAISRNVVGKNAQATIPKGNSGALAPEARAAEHHGWENVVSYPFEKIW